MKKPSLPFSKGDQVTYTCSATGIVTDAFITFVCPEYVTVCTLQWTMKEHFMVTNKSTW